MAPPGPDRRLAPCETIGKLPLFAGSGTVQTEAHAHLDKKKHRGGQRQAAAVSDQSVGISGWRVLCCRSASRAVQKVCAFVDLCSMPQSEFCPPIALAGLPIHVCSALQRESQPELSETQRKIPATEISVLENHLLARAVQPAARGLRFPVPPMLLGAPASCSGATLLDHVCACRFSQFEARPEQLYRHRVVRTFRRCQRSSAWGFSTQPVTHEPLTVRSKRCIVWRSTLLVTVLHS